MGIGPSVAIPAAVKSAGLELDDIDLFEINEVKGLSYFNSVIGNNFLPKQSHLVLFRHLLPSMCIALRNWSLILRKSMSTEAPLHSDILWALQVHPVSCITQICSIQYFAFTLLKFSSSIKTTSIALETRADTSLLRHIYKMLYHLYKKEFVIAL